MIDHPLGIPASPLRKRPEPVDRYWTEPAWVSESRRRRRRLLIGGAIGVAVIVVCLAAFVFVHARDNYIAGKRALAAGDYALAIRHLGAAKIAGRPYADARALLAQAVSLSNVHSQFLSGSRPSAASLTLRRATALFQASRYDAAERLVAGLPVRLPPAAAARLSASGNVAVAGLLLLVGADHALAAGNPSVARSDAGAVLVLYPGCTPAKALAAEAARRLSAAPYARSAAALAATSHWSLARIAARRAVRIDPAYPGMAALLVRINAAITRRNAARAAAAASAAASAGSTAPVTTTPAPPTITTPAPP